MSRKRNHWLSMWGSPRATVREIANSNPRYGVFYLVAVFMLQNLFFYAHWWSLGINTSTFSVILAAVILSPFLGMAWVYFAGWIFYFTGRWLNGKAPAPSLRAALAWSKIPVIFNLLMWIILLILHPKTAFVLKNEGSSIIWINFVNFATGIWSFLLLVQSIREIQHFSIGRSIINIVMGWVIYFLFIMIFSILFRYLYLVSV